MKFGVPLRVSLKAALAIAGIIILSVSTAVVGYYANNYYSRLQQAEKEISKLEADKSDLEKKNETNSGLSNTFSNLSLIMAKKFDELDAVAVQNDSESVDLINWYIQNAYFYGDAIQAANYKYGQWNGQHQAEIRRYTQIKNDLDELFNSSATQATDNGPTQVQ